MARQETCSSAPPTPGFATTVSREIADVRDRLAVYRKDAGGKVGLVPTMGCFHEGHLSLMRASQAECGLTVASIFVNPTQFGPAEDLESYPRDFERDLRLAENEGIGLVFAPSAGQMYPQGHATSVDVGDVAGILCGKTRPGHFNGVATIVAKLFNIIRPDIAWFGQKDAQQVAAIRRMAFDLDFPVDVRTCPTVREADGLAMSSRNCYLLPEEREQATSLYQALSRARKSVSTGETSVAKLRRLMKKSVSQNFLVELEYARIVDPLTMAEIHEITGEALGVVAARVGRARLIDNMILNPAADSLR